MNQADRLRFGDFELDVGAYRLRRAGRDVRLEQQPMDLLILLVQRRPHLVSREEIVRKLWGTETFVEAEAGINTAIRKARQALGDTATHPTFIERVPGKGYRFVGEVIDVTGASQPSAAAPDADRCDHFRRPNRQLVTWAATGVLVAAAVVAFFAARPRPPAPAPFVLPLTKQTGTERDPTFSPDGHQVAFAWDSAREDNFDIYVTLVGSAVVRQLTTDLRQDLSPAWSPNGAQIAYVRIQPPGTSHQLRVMSALGGNDRAVTDFPVWYQSSWSPDGRFLAAGRAVLPGVPAADNGIYLITVASGESRALTRPEYGSDYQPSFSPEGRRLAYASCREATFKFLCHVRVQRLDADLRPMGTPLTLTRELQSRISGVTWSRDGASIVYGAGTPTSALWRVRADGGSPPQRVEEAGDGAAYPASARSVERLVFSRGSHANHLYRFEPGRPAQPIAQSAGDNGQPDLSADGRIAFCSDRSGVVEVWTVAADGAGPRQLTTGPGRARCSPAWSPDDRRIAFDSPDAEGFYQIWIMAADGGPPRQLTQGPAHHNVPRWSHNAKWIYMSSSRGGTRDIWRADVETRRMEQITHGGSGFWSSEAADRTGILYAASNADSPLLFQAHTGGEPREIRPCMAAGSIAVAGERGIYYLPCQKGLVLDQPVHLFDPATGVDRGLGLLEAYRRPRDVFAPSFRKMALSADGGTILYTRRLPAVADLMVIENFR